MCHMSKATSIIRQISLKNIKNPPAGYLTYVELEQGLDTTWYIPK